jgi:thioredoxin reductase (NADPH)
MTDYDLLILGAGPAGLTAQIYAARFNLKSAIIGGVVGGLMVEPHKICNWPGENGISGADLTKKILEHVKDLKSEIIIDLAETITKVADGWQVATKAKKTFTARALLLALGTDHKKLNVDGEERLKGRGVTYCATCDAQFYKGKTVGVAGGGNSAMTAALYLADICEKVYLIYRYDSLKGEQVWLDEVNHRPNIIQIKNTSITALVGEAKLEKIMLDQPFDGASEVAAAGIFIEVGIKPKVDLFAAAGGEVDEKGRVKVKTDQTTNLPCVWAAGDITVGSNGLRQILTAASEGAIAAENIYKTLRVQKV